MQLKAQDRRAIIEDLLDIQIFSNMGNILKTYSAENKLKLDENRSSKNLIENKINLKEDYYATLVSIDRCWYPLEFSFSKHGRIAIHL